MALALPTTSSSTGDGARGRLHNFGWFLAGVLALFLILKIQSGAQTPQRFLSEQAHHVHHTPTQHSPSKQVTEQEPNGNTELEIVPKPKTGHGKLRTGKPTVEAPLPARMPPWASFERLFTFGDSYTSIWFNPNGKLPSRLDPYGNRHYNNPPLWVQYLTQTHNASFLRTYDFAVGGSTVDRALATPFMMGTTFKEQVLQKFIPLYTGKKRRVRWNAKNSLFTAWFGVNDIFGTDKPPISKILKSYEKTAEELYSHGARHMLFFTVPPFERSSDKSILIKTEIAALVNAFNSRIYEMRRNLQRRHPDLNVAIFDAYSLWIRLMDGPRDFEETKTVKYPTTICRDPEPRFPEDNPYTAKCAKGYVANYLWYGIHGTFTTHNATAKRLVDDCFAFEGPTGFCS